MVITRICGIILRNGDKVTVENCTGVEFKRENIPIF